MRLIIGGKVLDLANLGAQIDQTFAALYGSYFGHGTFDVAVLSSAAEQFFATKQSAADHDQYFNNFTPLWSSFLQAGNYDQAEFIWNLALAPALSWEQTNPGRFIHKGTAYYFWAWTALVRGDLDKGYALMHQGVEEDRRTLNKPVPDTPGYAFASLNYAKVDQAFRQWLLDQATYLERKRARYATSYGRPFTLDDFRRKFLLNPPSTDVSFLFAYAVSRLMRISSLPKHILQSQFASQIEANVLFDVVLVIDSAIRAKNTPKWKFIDHAKRITNAVGQPDVPPLLVAG